MKKTRKKQEPSRAKTKVHPAAINLLTDATWEFAHATLWNNFPYNKAETAFSKTFIREYYQHIPAEKFQKNSSRYFAAYCERILLAKNYVSRFAHRYIPHPCMWLDKRNPKGFAGTKAWYENNLKRKKQQVSLTAQEGYAIIPLSQLFHTFQFTA